MSRKLKRTNHYIEKLPLIIPPYIYSFDNELIEEVIGSLLLKNKYTLSTAENGTGGNIAV